MRRINRVKGFLVGAVACGMVWSASAGVVAYWPFREKSLNDESGNENTLTAVGVKFNAGAAVMDGYHSIFSTVSNLNLSAYSAVTIECYVKTASTNAQHMLLETTEAAFLKSGGLMMALNVGTPGQLQGRYYVTNNLMYSYKDFTDTTNNVSNGAWRHVALVVDRDQASDNDRVKLYLDGVLQSTNSWDASGSPAFKDGKLYIGSRANGSEFAKFVGSLDDIRISDAALTPSEFLPARTAETPTIAYWPFICGEEREDATGNGNTLVSSGAVFSNGVAVLNGSAVSFFNTAANLSLSGYSALTVEYFVRTASKTPHFILELGPVTYMNPGTFYHAINLSSNGQLSCSLKLTADNCFDKTDWTNDVSDGAWHHVAMVYDSTLGGSSRVRIYLDGTPQSVSVDNGTSATTLKNDKLYIGSRGNGTGVAKFVGELDDIKITGAALTPDLFLQSRTESAPAVIAYWPFADGSELSDASGNGYTLSSAGVVFRRGAAVLDGAQAVFNTASDLQLIPYTMLTVEYFLRTTDTNQHFIVESTTNANNYASAFNSCINVSGPGLINSLAHGSNGGYGGYKASTRANDGLWHHVALVFDRGESNSAAAKLYLDGVAQTTTSDSGYGNTARFQSGQLYIGSRYNGTGRPKYVGELDDIKITGAALAPAQFMQSRSETPPTVVAYWPFNWHDELSDASGHGNTLQKGSGVSFQHRAAVLDGSQTLFNTASSLTLSPYRALTVEYFVQTVSASESVIVETSGRYWNYQGTFISEINTGYTKGQVFSKFSLPGGFNEDRTDASVINVSDGAWHHVAIVYDPYKTGADRSRLYIDRVPAQITTNAVASGAVTFQNHPFYIGFRRGVDAGSYYTMKFTGCLDDIKITGAALDTNDFMQARSGVLPSELGTKFKLK